MEYKTLPFAPNYQVSRCGKSIVNSVTGKHLKTCIHKVKGREYGYLYVTLLQGLNFYFKCMPVHRVVCRTWHGEPPEGKPWVNHKDGDKLNNSADNLEWTSISENIKHKFDTGLYKTPKGVDHWLYGKKVRSSTKALMSKAKMGVKHPKFTGYYVIDGVKYPSSIQAAKVLGMVPKTVYERCKKKPNKWANFFFEPFAGLEKK
jgi:hypothetical protein